LIKGNDDGRYRIQVEIGWLDSTIDRARKNLIGARYFHWMASRKQHFEFTSIRTIFVFIARALVSLKSSIWFRNSGLKVAATNSVNA